MAHSLQTPLRSVLNFRDVGEYVNRATESGKVPILVIHSVLSLTVCSDACTPGCCFAVLGQTKHPFRTGHDLLKKSESKASLTYGPSKLYFEKSMYSADDVRTEHIEQAQKRDANIKASAALPQTNDEVAEPLKIPGLKYFEINFNGSSFSRMLISKLSWLEFLRLAELMLFGYRKDAIKILSPHMEEMGLIGLAKTSLDVCQKEVKQVFDVLAEDTNWPVLVHCTQGKDRTGLIIMLVLFLLDVDQDVIDKDYRLSESELAPEMESRIKEIASIGLSEQFAVCPPGVVASVHAHVEEKYGGTQKYLEAAGISKEAIERLRQRLLE